MQCMVGIIALLILGILVSPITSDAQQAGKIYRVGFLGITTASEYADRTAALRQGLRDLGYGSRSTSS